MVTMLLAKIQSLIAFTIGRTFPNMDLSPDFMELVVVDWFVDLGGEDHITKRKSLGLRLPWTCLTFLSCIGLLGCFAIVHSMRWRKMVNFAKQSCRLTV